MKYLSILLIFFFLFSCQNEGNQSNFSLEEVEENTLLFNNTLDSLYHYHISLSPVSQTYEGLKTDNDKWDLSNDSVELFYYEMDKKELAFINSIDPASVNHQAQLTLSMYKANLEESIHYYDNWQDYYYPVNQMFGSHTWFPSFMMDVHTITSKEDALAWLSRMSQMDTQMAEVLSDLDKCKAKGVIAPKFVYPYVIKDCQNLLQGSPFNNQGVNPLIADYTADVNALTDLNEVEKQVLLDSAEVIMMQVFKPAYESLISYMQEMEKIASTDAGVWKFKNGDKYYLDRLKSTTTTRLYSSRNI